MFGKKTRIAHIPFEGPIGLKHFTFAKYEKIFEKVASWKPDHLILSINSPGGSPVQSELIANGIRRLARQLPYLRITASIQDYGASGGYWLACAADTIIASEMSVVGSVGVVSGGFGFPKFIEKHGIERRLYTAGKSKASLDPFKPALPAEIDRRQQLLDSIHGSFRNWVKSRRPKIADETMNADVYVGQEALALNLVDRFIDVDSYLDEVTSGKLVQKEFSPKRLPAISRLFGFDAKSTVQEEIAAGIVLGVERTLTKLGEDRISFT